MYGVKVNGPGNAAFVIRPSVTLAIVYFGLYYCVWYLLILSTAKYPSIDATEPHRLITATQLAWVTALNAAFLVAFAIDGFFSRRSPPGLRRAHFAGLVLAVLNLALAQLLAFYAYGPISQS